MTVAAAMIYLTVFAGMFALDFVWAYYTLALTGHRPWRAGVFAGAIILVSGFVTVSYVENHWLLIPAALGAVVGTVVASKTLKPAPKA